MGKEADDIPQQRLKFLILSHETSSDDEGISLRVVLENDLKVGFGAKGTSPYKQLVERV